MTLKRNRILCGRCGKCLTRYSAVSRIPMLRCLLADTRFVSVSDFYRSGGVPCNCMFGMEHKLFPSDFRKSGAVRNVFVCKQNNCSCLSEQINGNNTVRYCCQLNDKGKFRNIEQFNARIFASECRYQLEHYIYWIDRRKMI